jgi:hypothetical protein
MTNKNETKRPRNYAKEWTKRLEKQKRLSADLDRTKVERLQDKLAKDGRTYASWLNEQIDVFIIEDIEPCSVDVLAELHQATKTKTL